MTEQEARAEALRRWPDDETLSEETRDGLMATRYGFEAGVVWERSRHSSREAAPSDTDAEPLTNEALWDFADDLLELWNIEDLNPPSLTEQFRDRFVARFGAAQPVQAPSDTDRDFKRIPAETRAELIHMAEGRIKDVWADSPEGVDAATLASNVVAAQEFVWMQLAAGVDLRTSQPVQVEPLWETRPDGSIGPTEHGLKAWDESQPVQVEVTDEMVERAAKAIAIANNTLWDIDPQNPDDVYVRDARAALMAALGGGE